MTWQIGGKSLVNIWNNDMAFLGILCRCEELSFRQRHDSIHVYPRLNGPSIVNIMFRWPWKHGVLIQICISKWHWQAFNNRRCKMQEYTMVPGLYDMGTDYYGLYNISTMPCTMDIIFCNLCTKWYTYHSEAYESHVSILLKISTNLFVFSN